MPKKFLGIVGQDHSVSKSGRLYVHIFRFCIHSFEVHSTDIYKSTNNSLEFPNSNWLFFKLNWTKLGKPGKPREWNIQLISTHLVWSEWLPQILGTESTGGCTNKYTCQNRLISARSLMKETFEKTYGEIIANLQARDHRRNRQIEKWMHGPSNFSLLEP